MTVNIMSGYGVHINALTDADVTEYKVGLGRYQQDKCVAVWGEDLARGLAAVVYMGDEEIGTQPALVWSETPIKDHNSEFAISVAFILRSIMPHLQ